MMKKVTGFALVMITVSVAANAQLAPSARSPISSSAKDKLNAWTVGLAGGLLEGAPIRFATEMARVVDDGDNLHVLPIVTRGPSENIESLLYLRGVDAAIINSDSLAQFKSLVPDVQNRIAYIINLFPSEVQILAGPGVDSLADLKGKTVNFNTPGTAAAYSGPLIFDKLKIEVDKAFIPHQVALEKLRKGELAALVFVTTKPVDLLTKPLDAGFKLLPVPYDGLEEFYLPSSLTSADYPQLIAADKPVETIAVPTVLAAFNWPRASDRYRRVERLTQYLFDRIDRLKQPGFHPKWKDVNTAAVVPGLKRFPAAQEFLDRTASGEDLKTTGAAPQIQPDRVRQLVRDVSGGNKSEEDRLFRAFLKWDRSRQ